MEINDNKLLVFDSNYIPNKENSIKSIFENKVLKYIFENNTIKRLEKLKKILERILKKTL